MPPSLTIAVEPGTYYVAVDSVEGSSAEFSISLADLGGGDAELPAGALGMLDFKNGVYKWGETTYTAAEVIDQPGAVVPGLGLYLQAYDVNPPFDSFDPIEILAGDFFDHIAAGDFTVVLETYTEDFNRPFFVHHASFAFGALNYEIQPDDYQLYQDLNEARELINNQTLPTGYGVPVYNITALTRTDAHIAFRVSEGEFAGTTFEDTDTGPSWAASRILLGGDASGSADSSVLYTRIVFYPSQDNAALGGLLTDPLLEAPANDDFDDAIVLTLDTPITAHNFRATTQAGEPDHGSTSSLSSVWYKFVAPSTATFNVVISPIGDFNGNGPVVGVYTGSAVGSLSEVASGTNWPGVTVPFTAVSGTTYRIAVDGAGGGDPGSSPFTITVEAA